MADGDLTVSGNATGDPLHLSVGEDGGVVLPDNLSFSDASFSVQGDDLVMSWPDGSQASVEGFGAGDMPTLSDSSGIEMSGDMAFQMAQLDSPAEVSTDFSYEAVGEVITGTDGSPIGTVEEAEGSVWAIRVDGSRVELNVGDPVFQGDVLESGPDGSVGVILADDTTFSMGEDGQMVLDEMVYDPSTQEGSVSVSVLEGVFTFVSGQVAKTDPDAMSIDTPVATIGIRGTQVGINLSEEEGMDVVLMEEADGFVGEVVLQNDGGVEILNTAFAASSIESFDTPPQAGFTMDTVEFLQSFGASLKALPGANNANTYGADEQDLEQLIQQAVEEAQNAVEEEEEVEEAEAEAEAAAEDEAEAADAEAEAEADAEAEAEIAEAEAEAEAELAEIEAETDAEELEELQEIVAEEAEEQAAEAQETIEGENAEEEDEQEIEVEVVPATSNEPIPVLELVEFDVDENRIELDLTIGTDGLIDDIEIIEDDRNEDTTEVEVEVDPNVLTATSLQDLIAGQDGGSGVITANADGTYSVTQGGDGTVNVDLSSRTETFRVSGGEVGDSVILGSGNDTVSTGDGGDFIVSGAGDDVVDAGTGADIIVGGSGAGDDTYIGGEGVDWAVYSNSPENSTLLFNLGGGSDVDADGNPTGTTTITLADGTEVTINANTATDAPDSASSIDTDTLLEIENLVAGGGDDVVVGSDGDNVLMGSAGDDYLMGGGGDDILIGGVVDGYFDNTQLNLTAGDVGNDTLVGGEGTDTVVYQASFESFSATIDDDGNVRLVSTDANGNESVDTLIDVELVDFSGEVFSVAVPPVVSVSGTVDEDTGIPIDIPLDTETSLGIDSVESMTISGIPDGAVLTYAGTDGETVTVTPVNGFVSLTGDQVSDLQVIPPENDSTDFSLSISAQTVLGQTNAQEDFTVKVTPVVDTDLQIDAAAMVDVGESIAIDVSKTLDLTSENLTTMTVAGQEVELIQVKITDQTTGLPIDGATASVTISGSDELGALLGLSESFSFSVPLPVVDGVISVPASVASTLILNVPDDYAGTIAIDASATVVHDDDEYYAEEITADTVSVTVAEEDVVKMDIDVVNAIDLTALNAASDSVGLLGEDQSAPVTIDDLVEVTISGLPAGATLTAGTDQGDGTWSLTPADLEGLQIAFDPDQLPDADGDGQNFDFSLQYDAIFDEEGANAVSGTISVDNEDAAITIGTDSNDTLTADETGGEVFGLDGDDKLTGGSGDDTLTGGSGIDELFGGIGDDELFGGTGDDFLTGGTGSDILTGGIGSDTLTGGEGSDTFIFDAESGADIITDIMEQDTIVFDGEEFHAEDMIFREAEDGDVEIAFANNDTSVKLEGVRMEDINTETGEGYSVTETDGKVSVSIDGTDPTT